MRSLAFALLTFLCTAPILSGDVVYHFTVNTSSILGAAGSLDFQFNPGPVSSQAASLEILNFASDGSLSPPPSLVGDVSGTLPATLLFDNGTAFNDYFEGFTFGLSLAFDVRLFGPAINAPDHTSPSGSAFAFSMFSDSAGTVPTLTTDSINGFATIIDINLDGSTTVTNFSDETGISQVPEPGGLAPVALLAVCFGRRWLYRRPSITT